MNLLQYQHQKPEKFKNDVVCYPTNNVIIHHHHMEHPLELLDLPDDILLYIFTFLDEKSLVRVGQISNFFNSISSNHNLWKELFRIKWGPMFPLVPVCTINCCHKYFSDPYNNLEPINRLFSYAFYKSLMIPHSIISVILSSYSFKQMYKFRNLLYRYYQPLLNQALNLFRNTANSESKPNHPWICVNNLDGIGNAANNNLVQSKIERAVFHNQRVAMLSNHQLVSEEMTTYCIKITRVIPTSILRTMMTLILDYEKIPLWDVALRHCTGMVIKSPEINGDDGNIKKVDILHKQIIGNLFMTYVRMVYTESNNNAHFFNCPNSSIYKDIYSGSNTVTPISTNTPVIIDIQQHDNAKTALDTIDQLQYTQNEQQKEILANNNINNLIQNYLQNPPQPPPTEQHISPPSNSFSSTIISNHQTTTTTIQKPLQSTLDQLQQIRQQNIINLDESSEDDEYYSDSSDDYDSDSDEEYYSDDDDQVPNQTHHHHHHDHHHHYHYHYQQEQMKHLQQIQQQQQQKKEETIEPQPNKKFRGDLQVNNKSEDGPLLKEPIYIVQHGVPFRIKGMNNHLIDKDTQPFKLDTYGSGFIFDPINNGEEIKLTYILQILKSDWMEEASNELIDDLAISRSRSISSLLSHAYHLSKKN